MKKKKNRTLKLGDNQAINGHVGPHGCPQNTQHYGNIINDETAACLLKELLALGIVFPLILTLEH